MVPQDPADVLILCGGQGTRLQPVIGERPKALAPIGGRPFLDLLVEELLRCGLQRLVLCLGNGSGQIVAHLAARTDAEFVFSVEDRPLGTGGAVRYALGKVRSDPFLVVNGDSFCKVDYAALRAFHAARQSLLTIVVAPAGDRADAGRVALDGEGRIVAFEEKPRSGTAEYINAGIYLMQREALTYAPVAQAFSLERDLFPSALGSGRCFAFRVSGPLTDIGTPERYRAAQ